jgi:hypothetical protein
LALLPTEALDLCDGQSLNAQCGQGFSNFVQLERLDDRHYQLHASPLFGLLLHSYEAAPHADGAVVRGLFKNRAGIGKRPEIGEIYLIGAMARMDRRPDMHKKQA